MDISDTIYVQFSNSPILRALAQSFADAADPSSVVSLFYDDVMNLETAVGHGLDIIGKIVGVSRVLPVAALRVFGWEQGGYLPFGQGPWYREGSTENYALSDDDFRTLIKVKALSNISNQSITVQNKVLTKLFADRGEAFVLDLGNMKMRYIFRFVLSTIELAILTKSGALFTPTGVGADLIEYEPGARWGFAQAGGAPFGHGTFFGGIPVAID